jgi:hypothetical protein
VEVWGTSEYAVKVHLVQLYSIWPKKINKEAVMRTIKIKGALIYGQIDLSRSPSDFINGPSRAAISQ